LTEYLTEKEQLQQLMGWIKKYGVSVIAGMLLAIIAVWALHSWQKYRENFLIQASNIYADMLTAESNDQAVEVDKQANLLVKKYAKTPYAQIAALTMAYKSIEQNNLSDANQHLEWAMRNGTDSTLKSIARLRLARLLIAENKPTDALNLLDKFDDKSFGRLANEIRGDIALSLNQPEVAKKLYDAAINKTSNPENQSILDLKSHAL